MNKIKSFFLNIPTKCKAGLNKTGSFFVRIGKEIAGVGKDFVSGDIFVKASLFVMGIGFFRRKQFVKGFLFLLLQFGFIYFILKVGAPNLAKLGTLGTVEYQQIWSDELRMNITNDYDHSLKILLFSLISIVIILAYAFVHFRNIKVQRQLQQDEKDGKTIPSFITEVKIFFDSKFHVTLLSLPVLGIIILTVIPLIFMILVAFTNFDQYHYPPLKLFTWVGLNNFKLLFQTGSSSVTYAYAFRRVVSWTLIWAFFATFLTYIGGILLALLINSKYTRWKKMWRTLFVITIAVPQFVSLLLVRNFFATQGIVNTLLANWGVTDWLIQNGFVSSSLSYIPFLTDEVWSKVMLILINCWIGFPYVMLITTGVLMNIPKDLYDSARIDGANKFQVFRKITMPYMLFVTAPYLITSFIGNMNNFNVIYLLTSNRITSDQLLANANASDTDLLITWLFKLTQDYYNYKMASVIGIVIFVISAIFTLLAFNYTIKSDKESRFQL